MPRGPREATSGRQPLRSGNKRRPSPAGRIEGLPDMGLAVESSQGTLQTAGRFYVPSNDKSIFRWVSGRQGESPNFGTTTLVLADWYAPNDDEDDTNTVPSTTQRARASIWSELNTADGQSQLSLLAKQGGSGNKFYSHIEIDSGVDPTVPRAIYFAFGKSTGFDASCWFEPTTNGYCKLVGVRDIPDLKMPEADASVSGSDTTTSTSYADLTNGPETGLVTCGLSGKMLVGVHAFLDNDGANNSYISPVVKDSGNAVVVAGSDARAALNFGTDARGMGWTGIITGLTPGTQYKVRAGVRVSGGTGTYTNRHAFLIAI